MRVRPVIGAAVVAAIALASVVGAAVTADRHRAAAHEADRAALTQITAGLRTEVLQLKAVVDGAAVVMRRESSDDTAELDELGEVALGRPGILSLSWAPRVTAAERARVERRLGTSLTAADIARGRPVPAPAAPVHFPVTWTASPDYAVAVAFDIGSMPLLRPALDAALEGRAPVASQPVPRTFDDLSLQVVLFTPVFDGSAAAPRGVVMASLDASALGALSALPADRFQVRDGDALLAGAARMSPDAVTETVDIAGRTWTVALAPSGGTTVVPLLVLFGGLGVAAAVALLMAQGSRREAYAMRLVERRLAERREAEDHLRRERDYSRAVVDALQDGLIVLDGTGRVTEANDRITELTGFGAREIVGQVPPLPFWPAEADADGGSDVLARSLAGGRHEAEIRLRRRDGQPVWAIMTAAPLHDDTGGVAGRVVTFKDISERHRAEEELAARASTDPLTGIANHRAFHERLRAEVERAITGGAPLAIALLDLDHFKQINDECGHLAGDAALRETARRILDAAREDDLVARVGGEEFAWLMPGCSGEDALAAAERARRAMAAAPIEEVGTVTLSAGVSDLSRAASAGELYRLADGALYWAKANGRNRAFLYRPDIVEALSAEEYAGRLERARVVATIQALARAVDAKDASTRRHSERVAAIAALMARELGWPEEEAERLHGAGLVHDVGKIGVPDAVLFKPGRLDRDEYEQVKAHAALGAQIVAGALGEDQATWVRGHHERWDGGGYPDGLAGEEIAEGARILALADAWDVMTVARHYSAPRELDEALAECRKEAGHQFWPEAVTVLERLVADGRIAIPTGDEPVAEPAPALAPEAAPA